MNDKDFTIEYRKIIERAISLSEKACREGLLSIEDLIDIEKYNQRDLFEFGLQLVLNGTEDEILHTIMDNIIELEQDKNIKTLNKIKKEAVLAFSSGLHPSNLLVLLNSYVNIDIEDTMKQYKELFKKQYKEEK